MSRVRTLVRSDLGHALRSRVLWGAVVLLGLMLLPSTASIASSGHRPLRELLLLIPLDLVTFALVVVAAVGYNAVVGERVAGTLRTVLGLGGTRRALVISKFISRSVVVVIALASVLAIANLLVARGYGAAHLLAFWTMGAWMLVYAIVWTAVTVGYSAAFNSRVRTLGALVLTYGVFSPFLDAWGTLVQPVIAVVFTGSTSPPAVDELANAPLWFRLTERLNPLESIYQVTQWSIAVVGPGTPRTGLPIQLFGTAVVVGFGGVVLAVGSWRFERADLTQGGESRVRAWRRWLASAVRVPIPTLRSRSASGQSRVWTIARTDIRHALQQWLVVGAIALVSLLVAPQLWSGIEVSHASAPSDVVRDLPYSFVPQVLVLGAAVGYGAVVAERESGTVRLVLGATGRRRDLLVGKLVARLCVAGLALLPLLLFTEALVLTRLGEPFLAGLFGWAGWLLWLTLVWTAFVVGISASVATRYRTLVAIFGTYLFFGPNIGLWGSVVRPVYSFIFTGRASAYEAYVFAADRGPLWFELLDNLNPFVALETIQTGLFALGGYGDVGPSASLFVYSLIVSILFAAVPLAIGYRRLTRADLG